MKHVIRTALRIITQITILPVVSFALIYFVIRARFKNRDLTKPKFVFGSTPIISFSHWSKLLTNSGYDCTSWVKEVYSINSHGDWDIVQRRSRFKALNQIQILLHFVQALNNYDVFVMSCDGFLIGTTKIWRLQHLLFKFAKCKSIVFPYGGDAYVYSKIRSPLILHGLMMSYPKAARNQKQIKKRVQYWVSHADIFIPGLMGLDGFGRWDVPTPSPFQIDLGEWRVSSRMNSHDGRTGEVVLAHAPNHRGFKGTEIIQRAVKELQQEGLLIDFLLLEGLTNTEVKRILAEDVDVLIDQVLATGYALNAIEGMATGLPVICNLEDQVALEYLNIWSFLSSNPIISANLTNLKEKIMELVINPSFRHETGQKSREYVERYHGQEACIFLFESILKKLRNPNYELQNAYSTTREFLG